MPTDAHGRDGAGDWPEEFFLEGPVPGGDDLLRRTVETVHRRSARSARLRAAMVVIGVVLVGLLLTSIGMAIGRASHAATAPRTEVVATDPATGARMEVTLAATVGGTSVTVTMTNLPIGTACHLTLIGKRGGHLDGGSWQVGPDAAQRPVGTTTLLRPSSVAEVQVTTSTGATLVGKVP
ncbi:MAG TPA: hypothetical protein VHV74_07275 [Pseudonocardiaceae bacterium]|jgi:hypothetical protein|nr:hypothetical protein [Pseudonocardiaceae bacterium]